MARRPTRKTNKKIRKKTTRSASRRRRSAGAGKTGIFQRVKRWPWLKISAALLMVLLTYTLYLDFVVRSKFEDKRWALPAKVYARPLELYTGLELKPDAFERELNLLNYRYAYRPEDSGTFQRFGDRFEIVMRGFTFWDTVEPSRPVEVRFTGDRISAINNTHNNEPIALMRLDPVLVGGIYPLKKEDRTLVSLNEVPELLPEILVAVEDRKFYQHHGIDILAIGRAFLANIRAGRSVQGGSTITQQLVKNFFLTNDRTLWRKFNEIIMAVLLDWHYDKNEIMEAYINEIYLGQDKSRAIHGFGLASEYYFARPLHQLKLNELATLVALIRGPSFYDPDKHPKRLLERRNRILDILLEQKVISRELFNHTRSQPIHIIKQRHTTTGRHPAFFDFIKRQLREYYPESKLNSEGLRIFTTMDPLIQLDVEKATRQRIRQLDKQRGLKGQLQAAVVIANSTSAEVLAMIGDSNPEYSGFNRALDAQRPIGSLMKPVVYLSALREQQRYTWSSRVSDSPISLQGKDGSVWSPTNYDNRSHGEVTLITALTHSYNQATVRLGLDIGFESINQTYRALGGPADLPPYPAILLGSGSLSPLEVSQIYQTLAANGFRSPLRAIREVLEVDNQPLRRYPIKVKQAMDADLVTLINSGLIQVTKYGTARSLQQRLPDINVAGKTGTTNDTRDSWFAGFTGSHVGVVWLGTDDNTSTGLTGSSGALRLWGDIFTELNTSSLVLEQSDKVETHWIDAESGLLSSESCANSMYLAYLAGTAPEESGPCQRSGVRQQINKTVEWFKKIFR